MACMVRLIREVEWCGSVYGGEAGNGVEGSDAARGGVLNDSLSASYAVSEALFLLPLGQSGPDATASGSAVSERFRPIAQHLGLW